MLRLVREDAVCRRLMTVPGVGPVVAITFTSAVDDPGRFTRSKAVGAHFGLTPKKYQSGQTDVTGGITWVGDALVRTALYEAANAMLKASTRFSSLKRWAMEVAKRRGVKRAKVALARKLATVLHRMWVDGTPSAGARRQQQPDDHDEVSGGRPPTLLKSRRRDERTGKAANNPVAGGSGHPPRVLRSARRLLSDPIMWRPRCRPRTEA